MINNTSGATPENESRVRREVNEFMFENFDFTISVALAFLILWVVSILFLWIFTDEEKNGGKKK